MIRSYKIVDLYEGGAPFLKDTLVKAFEHSFIFPLLAAFDA
jgi:hypothetical protein